MLPILLLTLSAFSSPHPEVISLANIQYDRDTIVEVDNTTRISVRYHGYNESTAIETLDAIRESSVLARSYLENEGMSSRDCKILSLDVYDIDRSDLNNRGIIAFFRWGDKSFSKIYAFYDSILSPPGRSSIFISASKENDENGLSERKRAEILSHEMMHYWQDRTCNISHDLEEQADRFGIFAQDRI